MNMIEFKKEVMNKNGDKHIVIYKDDKEIGSIYNSGYGAKPYGLYLNICCLPLYFKTLKEAKKEVYYR